MPLGVSVVSPTMSHYVDLSTVVHDGFVLELKETLRVKYFHVDILSSQLKTPMYYI